MTMTDEASQVTNDDLAARLAAAERTLAAIQAKETVDLDRLNTPALQVPIRNWWVSALEKQQEEERVARVLERQAEDEAKRLKAIKDAPRQAKRDKALTTIDDRIAARREEIAKLEEVNRQEWDERVQLARRPL